MHIFDRDDVQRAFRRVCSELNIQLDEKMSADYQNGLLPELLAYEKLGQQKPSVPLIQKCLIGVHAFLNQPCQYYDIYRSMRYVYVVQFLDRSLQIVKNVPNIDQKLASLKKAKTCEQFDSCLFELMVASKYAVLPDLKDISFVKECSSKRPDLFVKTSNSEFHVECKKSNRTNDLSIKLRNAVRNKLTATLREFTLANQSACIDISFHASPFKLDEDFICDCCMESFRSRVPLINSQVTVSAKPLDIRPLETYTLFPSPKYFSERYGFREHQGWHGLVKALVARYAHIVRYADHSASTWLDDVEFDCGIKWRITNEELLERLQRISYKLLFKGLSQLRTMGLNSILHVWIERGVWGHRQEILMNFYNKLEREQKEYFSWLIFNETIFDVSPAGSPDLIEHAHLIQGPSATAPPAVTNVFVSDEGMIPGLGEFGIGNELPDIDSIF